MTTPYIVNFDSLADGPIMVDYPAGMTAGGILDFWQRPITDTGLAGPDQGKGGRYLIVGPEDDVAQYNSWTSKGVFVFQSATNNMFFGLRILSDTAPGFQGKLQIATEDFRD